jgi:carbamoyltransferase
MNICGVKLTHDGAVALIRDGKLVFSWEMEKINNNERYAKISDLRTITEFLDFHGQGAVDHLVFDGWHRTNRTHLWFGQEVGINLAPYRRGIFNGNALQKYRGTALDLQYVSYPHYSTHLASSYCTSPFARRSEDALGLVWDAHMFPYIYLVSHASGEVKNIGAVCHLIATAYFRLANKYSPFNDPIEYPAVLGISGKIMAYIAQGKINEEALALFNDAYRSAVEEVFANRASSDDRYVQTDLGEAIAEKMIRSIPRRSIEDADMLASLHAFFESKIIEGLREMLKRHPTLPRRLCMAGGAALNIKWNRAIRSSGLFDDVWVPPFPNDSGSAIGAACCAMLTETKHRYLEWDVYSGPLLRSPELTPGWSARPADLREVAGILASGDEPVIVMKGRAELGPRALGHRSILAPATSLKMRDALNNIKEREWYRPIAPICLEHRAPDIFDPGSPDPFMVFDHNVREAWRDRVPAICHYDGTARLQTINQTQDAELFVLLTEYERLTGVPLLCNTSANGKEKGFFSDVQSAMKWGRVKNIWSEGVLYSKLAIL